MLEIDLPKLNIRDRRGRKLSYGKLSNDDEERRKRQTKALRNTLSCYSKNSAVIFYSKMSIVKQ